jgi:hypothetical protein
MRLAISYRMMEATNLGWPCHNACALPSLSHVGSYERYKNKNFNSEKSDFFYVIWIEYIKTFLLTHIRFTMATKCILIQNMTPDSRINNELTLKSILEKKSIPFKKITCPPDTGNRHRQPHHLQLSSHAFIEFDSDKGISKFATFLNGYSVGFAILRANIRPAQGTTSDETKPPSWWDEEAWHDALAVKSNKTHIDVPVGEWPKLESTSSSSSIASSAVSQDSEKIKPVPRDSTYNATRKEYCAYCVRNTHSTENCKVLHYQWKT